MNLEIIRECAVRRQQAAHRSRAFHREKQRECEREDQALKTIIRSIDDLLTAQGKFGSAVQDASPTLLASIGIAQNPEATVLPVEVADREEVVEAPAVVVEAAMPSSARVPMDLDAKADALFRALSAEAVNGYAAIEYTRFAKTVGTSVATFNNRIGILIEGGCIQRVKSRFPEPGWATFRILQAKEAAE